MNQLDRKTIRFVGIRRAAALVWTVCSALALSACSGVMRHSEESGRTVVVASFYPLAFIAEEIGGSHVRVVNLVPTGVEPHDWSPGARDRQEMEQADVFVYNGLGFESWVGDAIASFDGSNRPVIVEASKGVDVLYVTDEHGKKGETVADPHVWVSPLQARKLAENVRDGLVRADPERRDVYEQNASRLIARLDDLHRRYAAELGAVSRKEFVVSHDSFGYVARDYGLIQVPIMGLAPDAEPTAQTMRQIAEFVRERGIRYIFFEELVPSDVAETLAKDAGVGTLVLSPMEGLTKEQQRAGVTYLTLMEDNLRHLLAALR
ncbi:MAG: hypothetical protein BLM47_04890 [Candidatus Reconcilbacillus cellulovorans]|uniref:ABC transporter substrate-binding protein n=1 Tax=Candidatus Reconcilbacillus cellulovorans TaxID=1906605 RepID=A0A2A6E210_9BACL|nr:MAG: hypothetical protein BLM47_04890 [Candidatus Reconcilbacillus cellulovorans]